VSNVIRPLAREVKVADTVLVSVPPVNAIVRVAPAVPYFRATVEVSEEKVIAGLIVKVATVEVSTEVPPTPEKVTIERYRYLFIEVVSVAVVNEGVVNPEPDETSDQATDPTAVVVSVATCHFIVRVKGDGAETVVKEKVFVRPAVVVSLAG
jgi:hypothetical protein